ncbi:MAG: hypothetical protein MSC31_05920 [Solirubrobacteraceae bacterium MAG38_C4-C5]|nr:hypothetical protein [Candidatus Siliceabacter maunaloa]
MSMVRKTVTLPEEVVAEVEQRANGNFSAYVTELLEKEIRLAYARELLAEHEAEFGPIPEEVQRRVDEQWHQFEEEQRRESRSTPAS